MVFETVVTVSNRSHLYSQAYVILHLRSLEPTLPSTVLASSDEMHCWPSYTFASSLSLRLNSFADAESSISVDVVLVYWTQC